MFYRFNYILLNILQLMILIEKSLIFLIIKVLFILLILNI